MKSWTKELFCVALAAAFLAVTIPRVLLPPLASAQRVPAHLRNSVSIEATSPAARGAEAQVPFAPSTAVAPPFDGPEEVADTRGAHRSRRASRGVARAPLPVGVRYENRHWIADLDALPPPRVALAGASIAPPGDGGTAEGYRIVSTDRMGLLRAAGIARGDVLVGVDGMPMRATNEALDALSRLRGARRATFEFTRGGARYDVSVELVGRGAGRPLSL